MNAVGFIWVVAPLIAVLCDVHFIESAFSKADYDAVLIAVIKETGIRLSDVIRQRFGSITVQVPHYVVGKICAGKQLEVVKPILEQVKTEISLFGITAWDHLIVPIKVEPL